MNSKRFLGFLPVLAVAAVCATACSGTEPRKDGDLRQRMGALFAATISLDTLRAHQFEGSSASCLSRVVLNDGIARVPEWTFAFVPVMGKVSLPPTVKEIGECAFFGCRRLADISLSGVQCIGVNAFRQTALAQVDLQQARTIGDFAFAECGSLRRVVLPACLDSMGMCAFRGCNALQECTIRSAKVGDNAFSECTSLRSVRLEGVKSIDQGAFGDCTALRSICLDGVRSIGEYAFNGCTSLDSVGFNGVESIGESAFSGCTSLGSVCLYGVRSIGKGAFSDCTSLGRIDLDGVRSIGEGAFRDCTSLRAVRIPSSVRYVGGMAFYGCEGLQRVVICSRDTKVEQDAFDEGVTIVWEEDF